MSHRSDNTKNTDNQENDNLVTKDDKSTLNGDDTTKENIFQKFLKKHESQKAEASNDKSEEGSSVNEEDKVCGYSNHWCSVYRSTCKSKDLHTNIEVILILCRLRKMGKKHRNLAKGFKKVKMMIQKLLVIIFLASCTKSIKLIRLTFKSAIICTNITLLIFDYHSM